jgi:hypothetical protein
VSQVARDRLGTGPGRAIAVAYGFSWGLQQMVEFDFHEIAFAVPLLAFSLSALVRGRLKAAVWWALPLVFVKEDQGFTVAAIGLYLIIAGLRANVSDPRGQHRMRAGLFLLIWGFAWSFLAIAVIIPHFNPAHHYDYWSDGGVLAPGGHLSVIGLAKQFLRAWPDKLQTSVMLLLPTAFIALRSPLALIACPSLLLRFLSTNSSFWGTLWHYNATVMPIFFVAAVAALARIQAAMDADEAAGFPGWGTGRRGRTRAVRSDVPHQPACRLRRGSHGQGSRWRHRADHARSPRAAGRSYRHLLDRQQRQPQDSVHRLRRPEQRLLPSHQQRSRFHRRALPGPRVHPDFRLRRRLRLPAQPVTRPTAPREGFTWS